MGGCRKLMRREGKGREEKRGEGRGGERRGDAFHQSVNCSFW